MMAEFVFLDESPFKHWNHKHSTKQCVVSEEKPAAIKMENLRKQVSSYVPICSMAILGHETVVSELAGSRTVLE